MSPAVENLPAAPPAAAARKKPPAPVQDAPPRGPQFQRELARKRKLRREEPEIRQAERKETAKAKKPAAAKKAAEQSAERAVPDEAVGAGEAAEMETQLRVEEASAAEDAVHADEEATSSEADAEDGDATEETPEGTQSLVAGMTTAAATVPAQAEVAHVDSFEPSATEDPPADAVVQPARARVEALTQPAEAAGAVELPDELTGETASDFEAPPSTPRTDTARPEVQLSGASEVAETPSADEAEPAPVVTNPAPSPAPSFESVASAAFSGATQIAPDSTSIAQHAPQAAPVLPDATTPPEVRFAEANHENIVRDMRAELLPRGGSMRIRLDPPQLGALQVTVRVQDGVVTAAFETSSDEATRLLGHSLNHLRSVLESHGVSVDKLQVQQSPREEQPSANRDNQHRRGQEGSQDSDREQAARQEQQRREMLRRMWRRLSGAQDPLDLTA